MITVKTYLSTHVLQPTIFPDGTSQVWKLPAEVLETKQLKVIWNFEAEREVIDLLSLRALLPDHEINLHIPYLPYGRQDKDVNNGLTFNLVVLAKLLNSMNLDQVTSVDTHNPEAAERLIDNFVNIKVESLHARLIAEIKPDAIVFPDQGASDRYKTDLNTIVCKKIRDQSTGQITGLGIYNQTKLKGGDRVLILDDICDGGATFIAVAKELNKEQYGLKVDLFVTHGIFSRGRQHLLDNGINALYTTNSLPKNNEGYEV